MTVSKNPLNSINQDFEIREAQQLASDLGLTYIQIEKFPINPDLLRKTRKEETLSVQAIPFDNNRNNVKIAVVDPNNRKTIEFIKHFREFFEDIDIYICTRSGLLESTKLFDLHLLNKSQVTLQKEAVEDENVLLSQNLSKFDDLASSIEKLSTPKAINQIEILALQSRASDIHIQPEKDFIQLRFRIDGILHPVAKISVEKAKKIILRIKYDSGMKANINNIPQDGHISFTLNNRSVEFRVSVLPTDTVESVVMRILDSKKNIKSFGELGFSKKLQKKLEKVMHTKNGLILLTGPTGSGKTTTLYAMLNTLNTPGRKIVTLEDPIEYHLEGITQSQVSGDYTFSSGLRALLRHDPDVILLGEIRDQETADIASEASLTGHVVFSSLHSNTAVGAITRLKNLDLESYNIAASLRAIISQRLIRKICTNCMEDENIPVINNSKFKKALEKVEKLYGKKIPRKNWPKDPEKLDQVYVTLKKPKGCKECSMTGFNGQRIITECLILDDKITEFIAENMSEHLLQKEVEKKSDFLTLFEDAVKLVLEEKTSLKEAFRVAG